MYIYIYIIYINNGTLVKTLNKNKHKKIKSQAF